jgi:hypothetical protein
MQIAAVSYKVQAPQQRVFTSKRGAVKRVRWYNLFLSYTQALLYSSASAVTVRPERRCQARQWHP